MKAHKHSKALRKSPFYIAPEPRPVYHGPKRQAKMKAEAKQ